jgi:hypothetical protein
MSIEVTMGLAKDLKIDIPMDSKNYNKLIDYKTRNKSPQYAKRNEFYREHKPTGKDLVRWKYQLYMKDFLRCVWSVDESVGTILDTLKEQGIDDNTIVMYSSDQGFYMGEHGWFDKRFMYEESFRTPLLARWPAQIKPGSENHDLVQNIDFAERRRSNPVLKTTIWCRISTSPKPSSTLRALKRRKICRAKAWFRCSKGKRRTIGALRFTTITMNIPESIRCVATKVLPENGISCFIFMVPMCLEVKSGSCTTCKMIRLK